MRKNLLRFSLLLFAWLAVTIEVEAQKNIAPQGTASASTCNTGACNTLNDLNFGNCGAQQMWISTGGPPSTTPGVEWLQIEWKSNKRFNKFVIHHGEAANRFLAGGLIQFWNGSAWVNHHTFSNLPTPNCSSTVSFNAISTQRVRITSFQAGPGQNSNMNFREIEVIEAPGGTNNAGVQTLNPVTFCPGTQSLSAIIENSGLNKLDSVRINWSVDNVNQPTIYYKTAIDTSGHVNGNTKSVTLGNVSFTAGVARTIKVWTSMPNGKVDTMVDNDMITVTLKPSLSGNFTINKTSNAGNNYKSFALAAADLTAYGVCGPVTFTVAPGTYSEQVTIGQVKGASSTNTVTFNGVDKATRTISFAGNATNYHVIKLDGSDYVTFKNFTVTNTGTSYGYGIHLTNKADYNIIDSCDVTVNSTIVSTNFIGIGIMGQYYYSGGDNGNYNTIKNTNVKGGYISVVLYGTSSSSFCFGNKVLNGNFLDWYQYGFYSYYQAENEFINNNILMLTGTQTGYGIYNYYGGSAARIERNTIYAYYMGMAIYYPSGSPMTIANNMVYGLEYSTAYGLYLLSMINSKIYHNSVFHNGANGYALYMSGGSGNDVRNNIFSKNGFNAYSVYNTAIGVTSQLDYNIYYSPGGNYVYVGGVYQDLAALKKAYPQHNKNSLSMAPAFISGTNLHWNSSTPAPAGAQVNVALDRDGDNRCILFPTIGADENNIGKGPSAVNFFPPSTIYQNSYTLITNTAKPGEPKRHKWYINGVYVSDSVVLYTNMLTAPTTTVKLVTTSCSGTDSVTKTLNVVAPNAVPTTEFIASANFINEGQTVRLQDISLNGPTTWKWNITPDSTFIGANKIARYKYIIGSSTSPNPVIRFDEPGVYKVCLTTSNAVGTAPVKCKTDYIRVTNTVNLGQQTYVTDTAGMLFDEGGPDNPYFSNTSKGIVLAPCSEEIYLTFTSFDLECGMDFVRVYDGGDNKGKPIHTCSGGLTGGSSSAVCASSCKPSPTDTFVAKSGKMFIEMTSNGSNNYNGFAAVWSRKVKPQTKPIAKFIAPDTICANSPITFQDATIGDDVSYYWDLDGNMDDFECTGACTAPVWPYFGMQPYTITVTMIAENCGGRDTFTKEIYVRIPQAPVADFSVDNKNPAVNEVVFFSPEITECVENYEWTFTGKGVATYVNGTSKTSAMPQVRFSDTGCYTVALMVKNVSGDDQFSQSCFVRVRAPYCVPSVATMIQDIGISRVQLQDINHASTQSTSEYQNFVSTVSTILEIGVSYDLTVSRSSSLNSVTRTAWIDWDQDGIFESNEKVGEQVNSPALNWMHNFTVPLNAKIGATILRVAINQGQQQNTPCGQNLYGEYEDYRIYVRPDLTAPVITLIGSDTVYVEQGGTYVDAGVTAEDNLDGNITSKVATTVAPNFNSLIPNTYVFSYNVKDAALNAAKTVRRVVIVMADSTAPVLIVSLPETIVMQVKTPFTYPKVLSAQDNVDGNVMGRVDTVSNVNANKVGSYMVTYKVVDMSGNSASVTRFVEVIDTIMPVMTLNGNDTVRHAVGTPYTDLDVRLSDDYYSESELRSNLVIQSNVDENTVGNYTVVYTLTDPFTKRTVTLTRVVEVRDTTAATLSLKGPASVRLPVFSTFNDPGINISDNFDKNLNYTTSGTFYAAFPNGVATKIGTYTVIYTVRDASGNVATISREIIVVDEIAPVITLKGDAVTNACRWSRYADAGVNISDNYYPVDSLDITTEGSFKADSTTLQGIFSLRYRAEDPSGNVSYSDWRYINVTDPYKFPCATQTSIGETIGLDKLINVYPNPNTGKFTVEANVPATEQVRISVTNLLGQEIAVISNGALSQRTFQVDLSSHKAGVYMLNITTSKQTTTKRVVITK